MSSIEFPYPQKNYTVVIYCQTYNQHLYIEDTLKGFVSQKTNFPFCAIVLDDCSTDSQQNIIIEYAKKYPEIIIPVLLPYNHYKKGENKDRYIRPWIERSEFVANCEGDDYWTDCNKLQIQVDFMRQHINCSLTYHACKNIFEEGYSGSKLCFGEQVNEKYTLKELLGTYPFQTATVLYRSKFWLSEDFQKIYQILHYSTVLFFGASLQGEVLGINKQMSIYRRVNSGISISLHNGDKLLKFLKSWKKIANLCQPAIKKIIHRTLIANQLILLYKISKESFRTEIREELKIDIVTVGIVYERLLKIQIKKNLKR